MEQASPLALVDILIIVGFLVIVMGVGYAMSKAANQGLEDYFLGGKKIPWWVLGISTSTSNFDMAGTMIIVAVVFALGYKGFLVEIRGGVGLSLAFLMIFLGKWLRRSRVMTSAEWMKLRFGTDKQGRAAHLLSALANILLSLGMIIYFAKGAGKFLTNFLPISELGCISLMVGVGLFYTLMSGLYGVVFTDVVQMVLLTFTAVFVSVHAFDMAPDVILPEGFLDFDLAAPASGGALLAKDGAYWEPIFNLFGLAVFLWVARTTMEGMGGVGGYTDQRFFAARTEREASLLTLEAMVLSVFRWTMVAGLVIMGLSLVQTNGPGADVIAADPEQVLPIVLGQLLPTGVKGAVIAGLIAAAMSTFDSTLNAGASYIVKDVYESYVNPEASQKQLINASRWATVGLCVAGIALAAVVPNINKIWGLITMGLGAGLFVPLFLRWYWPRFNGYGFASGTGVGIVTGLLFQGVFEWPLHYSFPAVVGSALFASVAGSLLTPKTDDEIVYNFWQQINPWGFWGKYSLRGSTSGDLSKEESYTRFMEKVNDAVSLAFAIPFQVSLLMAGMALIFHDWKKFSFFAIVGVISSIGLYFFWYKNLKSKEQCEEEDAYWEPRTAEMIGRRGPAAAPKPAAPADSGAGE